MEANTTTNSTQATEQPSITELDATIIDELFAAFDARPDELRITQEDDGTVLVADGWTVESTVAEVTVKQDEPSSVHIESGEDFDAQRLDEASQIDARHGAAGVMD